MGTATNLNGGENISRLPSSFLSRVTSSFIARPRPSRARRVRTQLGLANSVQALQKPRKAMDRNQQWYPNQQQQYYQQPSQQYHDPRAARAPAAAADAVQDAHGLLSVYPLASATPTTHGEIVSTHFTLL